MSSRSCAASFRRTNDEYDGGQAASRILTAGRRRRACGFAGAVGLDAGRRRTAGPACSVRRRYGAENGGRTGLEAVQGARGGAAAERLFGAHLRSVRGDPARAGHSDLERPEIGLFARAAASGLRLHEADRDQHCRERHGAEGDLRPRQFQLRRVEAACRSGRPRLFRLAHPQVLRPGLRRRGDLPGRDLLPRAGARPALRPHRARPCNSDRRRPGRRISAVPRVLDRKAESGGEYSHHSRLARFAERHRRLSLHAAPCGNHHHRHRDDADRADGGRQAGIWRHGRVLSVQSPRSSTSRRCPRRGLSSRPDCKS